MKLNRTRGMAATTVAALFAGSLLQATAQQKQPEIEANEEAQFSEQRTGCTWKLSHEGNTVYLAGSVHLLREEDYPLPKVLDIAYGDSDRLVFEIDMAEMADPMAAAMKMQKLGMLPQNESLSDKFSEETWKKAKDYFWQNLIPAAIIDRMKPGMVFLTVSSLEAQKLGAKPELGVETQFYERALVDKKPTSGLETMEYQLGRFDELTLEEHEELLVKTLDDISELPKSIGEIIAAWHSGDIKELDKLLNEQMEEGERLRQLLLVDRNKNWVPQIEEALKGEENVMFIVGAAHLIGKDSVVELLQKRGWKPELVKTAGSILAEKKAVATN